MLKKIYCLLAVLWCLMIGTAWAGGITITVNEQSEVKGPMLTLGELADISGDNADRITNLQALKLGSAPLPGENTVLTKELIGMRLSASGADLSDVIWQIPEKVNVTTSSQVVTGQSLLDCAIGVIKQYLEKDSKDNEVVIEALNQPHDTKLAIGELKLRAELPRNIRYNGPTVVKVIASIDGRQATAETVKLSVKMYKEVVVASKTMLSKEILSIDNLKYERMDISRLPHGFITDINKVVGLNVRRTISLGTVLSSTMVEKPVIVKRGDKVNIIARIGSTEITAPGQAMQDGTENQIIKVQNLNSQKIISAKILDGSSVLVVTYSGK